MGDPKSSSPSSSQSEREQPLRAGRPSDQRGIFRWMPGLYALRHYRPGWIWSDCKAGIVLTTFLVPVGMAYAEAAGLPAINGLYATIIPLVAYALFGPSRILVVGPDSSLAPLIAAAVIPLASGTTNPVAVAGMLAILAGIFGVVGGLLKLGLITDLLATPIRYGYMNGIALTVLVGQLPKLCGFSVKGDELVQRIGGIVSAVAQGRANMPTLILGASVITVILLLKRFLKIPGVLFAVVGAIVASMLLDLPQRGVSVLGELPRGFPALSIPWLSLHEIAALVPAAIAIVVVSFTDTAVLSRVYAMKQRAYVDPNQEMIGLGAANLSGGMFLGFPISSSSSRTPVAEASGSKTQLTGVVGAVAITVILLFAPALLKDLPYAALAAVVITSAIGLFEFADLPRLYRIQRFEFWLSIAAFLGVALLGPVRGMLIAIGIALAEFVWDAWRPHWAVLGRVDDARGYHDVTRYPNARQIPGLVVFRWDAPLFFANAEQFRTVILDAIATASPPVHWVIVSAAPVTDVDVTSVDMLTELDDALLAANIELVFAEMKDPVKDKIKRFGVFKKLGEHSLFPTLHAAIDAYLEKYPDRSNQR